MTSNSNETDLTDEDALYLLALGIEVIGHTVVQRRCAAVLAEIEEGQVADARQRRAHAS